MWLVRLLPWLPWRFWAALSIVAAVATLVSWDGSVLSWFGLAGALGWSITAREAYKRERLRKIIFTLMLMNCHIASTAKQVREIRLEAERAANRER